MQIKSDCLIDWSPLSALLVCSGLWFECLSWRGSSQQKIKYNFMSAQHSNITPQLKWFSRRCRKNEQAVTSSTVTEGFILHNTFPPKCFLSVVASSHWHSFISGWFRNQNFHLQVICVLQFMTRSSSRSLPQGKIVFPMVFCFCFLACRDMTSKDHPCLLWSGCYLRNSPSFNLCLCVKYILVYIYMLWLCDECDETILKGWHKDLKCLHCNNL